MLKKKKKASERFFSLIFVPDQEQDPRSISMSYAKGWLMIIGLSIVGLHILSGVFAYYQIYRLNKHKMALNSKIEVLQARNKKIEPIVKEFQEVRMIVDKIKKGFGSTLGLEEDARTALNQLPLSNVTSRPPAPIQKQTYAADNQQNAIPLTNYFLYMQEKQVYDPESLPTLLPIEGYLTTHFQKRNWYHNRAHHGIDIAAEKGTVIRAAGGGIVVLANWTPDLGHVVIIDHGGGFYSYYGHAMRLLVAQGGRVKKGQSIALLGSSGISSAPHLHFEIWKDGEPLDPESFLFVGRERKNNESS
ncbi:M23 family metallopeptidase [bacterium]|nr:M23 family metallopeptidase [bacterium]